MDVAGEAKFFEFFQEALLEEVQRAQVSDGSPSNSDC
jgi:hypothetical protein